MSAPYRRFGEFIDGPCERWNADDREEETTMEINEITPEDARHVLGFLHEEGGWEPGGFTSGLIAAALRADPGNRRRLRQGFPGLMDAVALYKDVDGGLEMLQQIAAEP